MIAGFPRPKGGESDGKSRDKVLPCEYSWLKTTPLLRVF